MGEQRSRPQVEEIKDAYHALFNTSTTLSKLKDAALGGRLLSRNDKAVAVAGRSLAWRLFLVDTGPLKPPATNEPARFPLEALRALREEYRKLLLAKMRAPDGGYEEGLIIPGTSESPPRTERTGGDLDLNNPLSLHNENPWTAWFTSMELRKTILQDVERTFPDMEYFRDQEVQAQLTNILFVYSVTHPDIGYRQGMHELLAPLYYAVDFDSIADDAPIGDPAIQEACSRVWVGADAWTLFSAVMRSAGRWYEWRAAKESVSAKTPLASHVHLSTSANDTALKPYVAPIIESCNRIQSVMLKSVDPQLWRSLQSAGIEPQIYGIRWLRLLFTREFGLDDAMIVWDGLFACDPSFELAPWICVAMLVRIRNQLIPADYSTQLTYLLRYPSLHSQDDVSRGIHPATLLLRQALTLQMSPTASTGISVVQENQNLLNITSEVPDPPPPPVKRRPRPAERGASFSGGSRPSDDHGGRTHARHASSTMGLPEMIARGLLERGESLGINKTVMNAVSELKRNLPDLANSLPRLPLSPNAPGSTFPLTDERPTSERPPWEPRTRFEMESDISELRAVQRRLGDSVGWIVDTLLLQDEGDEENTKKVQERKREALECLSYVRDVLKGTVRPSQVEEDRLVGEEELKRRRAKAAAKPPSPAPVAERIQRVLSPPQPAATASPAYHTLPHAAARRTQDYFTVGPSLTRTPPVKAPIPAQRAPSPTPTISVLRPNSNAVPLAPWNYTRSAFASSGATPWMPSRPTAAASARPPRPQNALQPPPLPPALAPMLEVQKSPPAQQDPLGALK